MSVKDVRNIAIIVAIAAIVDLVPGGGTVADVIVQAVSLFFLGALLWVVGLMYRDHRNALYSLGDQRRAGLYVAIGVLAVALTGTDRLWNTALGQVVWLVLVAGSLYAGGAMLWSLRRG